MDSLPANKTTVNFNVSDYQVQQHDVEQINSVKAPEGSNKSSSDVDKLVEDKTMASLQTCGLLSLNDCCKLLSISVATGKNWVKLGKLVPQIVIKQAPFFTHDYVNLVKDELTNKTNKTLKSRRNKKYITGNNMYDSYVSENSGANESVQKVLDYIHEQNIEVDELLVKALVMECAIQLLLDSIISPFEGNCLYRYLTGAISLDGREFLIDDILEDKNAVLEFIKKYPALFEITYHYEQNEDILGLLYISTKNLGVRKATGLYYTPTKVVKMLCLKLFENNSIDKKKVLDPCCGTGNFLLQLPENIPFENIYGNDIDIISVKIARINISLKYNIKEKKKLYEHVMAEDYLNHSFSEKFDYIIGNPPWGYEYTTEERGRLKDKYRSATGSNIESYDIFIEQALSDLCVNGVLSFVLPEALLNVKAHAPIRNIITQRCSFQYLHFLGNAFDGVQCPCIILQLIFKDKPFSAVGLVVNDGKKEFSIHTERAIDAECLSFSTTDKEYSILNKIETIHSKITLKNQAVFALGIVTGNNKKYICTEKNSDNEMILKGSNLRKFRYHKSDEYIIFNPESFQQVAPVEYYRAEEKLLYRFICNQLVFAYDSSQTLSLNSCNLLIPRVDGLSVKYIMAILNSRIAQFYFKKQFNSVKVLRSHIEKIPIPKIEKEQQEALQKIVEVLITVLDQEKILSAYECLDAEIARLYGLDDDEYDIIKRSMDGENLFLL
ncbi:MAG: N-6 DNA methylase [Lachnospiraceae bacterium]|nr:N-6 DNA methylase [Lachnospiraceae bacterium]